MRPGKQNGNTQHCWKSVESWRGVILNGAMSDVGKMLVVMGLLMAAVGALLWAGLVGAFAGGYQLFEGQCEFSFSHRDLPFGQCDFEPADVVVQEVVVLTMDGHR